MAESRSDRILTLIIDKVFSSITEDKEKELEELLSHPDENRAKWESLMKPDNLMNYISEHFKDGKQSDVEAAKAMFDKLIGKKS